MGDGTSGLQVINVGNPVTPTLAGSYDTDGEALRLTAAGNYVYLGDRQGGLKVINVSNPAQPILTGQYIATDFGTQFAIDVAVQNSIAYVVYDFLGLKIVDVTNPANPQVLKGIGTPSWAQNAVPVGNYLYLTYATGLMVIDISNPSTAHQVSTIALPGTTFGHTVNGDYLYTASWGLGVHIVDVNVPSSPQLITNFGTGLSRQIVIEGQYAYIANVPHGIAVLDISDPLTPSLVTTYATPGDVGDIAVSNGKIYVADSVAGLLILELTVTLEPNTFTDVGSMAGVTSPGSQAVSWADYDNDGDLDLFAVGPNRLYRNNGNGSFGDLTATAGLSDTRPVRGGGWADYDRDGDLDLYVTTSLAPNRLYRNNGNGTFTDVAAAAGVQNSEGEGHGVSWIDYNNDGWLDLFVTNSNTNSHRLYRNGGNGTFSDVTTAAGVVESGRSTVWSDYDRDGDLDFYVCKEGANRLYRNRGNGIFDEVGASAGVNESGNGHGAVWGDYNQDGYPDLYVANFGGTNRLYLNDGDGSFTEVGQSAGVDNSGNGTGAAWGDFDSDGDLDLYAVSYGTNRLYRNNGDGTFTEIGADAGVNDGQSGSDAIWADYDADGDLDIYVSTAGGSNRLYRNNGNPNRWIKIRLQGVTTNENGIGAQIKVVTGQLRQYRDMDGGVGFMSQSSLPVEFGFGSATVVDSLIIRWPSGIVQKLRNVATNQVLTITEAETPDPPALPVILKAGVAFGTPGDTLRIPVSLTNANPDSVAGIQFDLVADGAYAQFVGIEDTLSQQGFAVTALAHADTTRVLVFSAENTLIEPGSNTPILTALYRLTAVAPLGSTTPVAFSAVEIGDVVGVAFNDSTVNGLLQVGVRGDLNLDGRVSVLDIIRLARVLIGKDPRPVAGSVTFHIADANSDTEIDISDIVTQVNRILGVPSGPPAKPVATTVTVSLSDPVHLSDGTLALSLRIEADGLVAGLYATFSVDERIQTGLVRFTDDKAGFAVDSHLTDGQLRVVAYTMSPYLSLGESDCTILIPVFTPSSRGAITLTSLQAVDRWGRQLPVRITSNQALLEPDTAIPTVFSLRDASPNPFNPSTQFAYEVPQQAQVTLTVYNLLGQEVVTLVNEVKAAGRYTVTWNGRNTRGLAVASGVYVYRLSSSTGFVESRRMVLLK